MINSLFPRALISAQKQQVQTFIIVPGNAEEPVYIKIYKSITMLSNFPEVQKLEMHERKLV